MKRFRFISSILFVLLVFSVPSKGQSDTASMLVLSENEFLNLVRLYHPVVKQADFSVQRAAAALTGARAGFDPLLTTSFEKKKFGGDVYYSYYQPELKIPTWYGIEVYAGLEEISGTRVTSEATLGQTSYLGVSVPLLKDLVVDKRRAILKQAKIYQQQNLATRNLLINDLLYESIGAYWNWVKEYQVYKILDKTIALSEARLRFTSIEYQQGNRPAIDTVEALAQLQQFLLLRNEAFMKFQNAGTELSNFLWLENDIPYKLPVAAIPDTLWEKSTQTVMIPAMDELLSVALSNHPKLKTFSYKLDWLRVEQQLKFQEMLPKLDAKANLLNKGYNVFKNVNTNFLENNYKFGIDFSMPLRLSQGRGGFRETKFKVAETSMERNQAQRDIETKITVYYNETYTLRQQVSLMEQALVNYQRLLSGELARFEIGESSLFIVNTRENKVLELQQKLQETKTKFYKSLAALQWASGQLK